MKPIKSSSEPGPAEQIAHIVGLWQRGIICPGETWNQMIDATEGYNLVTVLATCEPGTQATIRALYTDRPNSLPPEQSAVRDWCVGLP